MTGPRGGRADEYGAVARRRVRSTGTTVSLFAPGAQAMIGEGWMTVCEEHGGVCSHETRHDGEAWLAHPEQWCPYCMGDVEP